MRRGFSDPRTRTSCKYDIVVMVQGDEPMAHPNMINEAVEPMLRDGSIRSLTCLEKLDSENSRIETVLRWCCLNGDALYFSREPIPTTSKTSNIKMFKQVCIIPFTRDFLLEYTELSPTPLEIAESVDMMRVLEYGMKVRMVPTRYTSYAVDVP